MKKNRSVQQSSSAPEFHYEKEIEEMEQREGERRKLREQIKLKERPRTGIERASGIEDHGSRVNNFSYGIQADSGSTLQQESCAEGSRSAQHRETPEVNYPTSGREGFPSFDPPRIPSSPSCEEQVRASAWTALKRLARNNLELPAKLICNRSFPLLITLLEILQIL